MHPGPINRGVEMSPDVADGPFSVILEQVEYGVACRMAILYLLSGRREEERKDAAPGGAAPARGAAAVSEPAGGRGARCRCSLRGDASSTLPRVSMRRATSLIEAGRIARRGKDIPPVRRR